MANTNIVIDTRRPKNDNTYPIYLRLTHDRKSRNIATGTSAPEEHWNYKKNCVKSSYEFAARLNFIHDQLKTDAKKIILENQKLIAELSIDQVKDLITGKGRGLKKSQNFFEFGNSLVDRYKKAKKIGSAAAYKCCIQIVANYVGETNIHLKHINYQFLLDFEAHLLGTGVKVNSIGGYMRHLRAIMNQAILEGIISADDYPFKKFRIKKEKTIKRAISKDDILKITKCCLQIDQPLTQAKNLFTFMFHARGMNFVDLARLKHENIQADRLIYRRQKTGKLYNIKLTSTAQELIQLYTPDSVHPSDYIFPIIPSDVLGDFEKEWLRITDARKHFNINLKKLAKLTGVEANLTSYVVRHSWASIAKFSGIAPAVIGESLGHSDLKTTETYLAEFEHSVLDNANDLIVS